MQNARFQIYTGEGKGKTTCGKRHAIFGESHVDQIAQEFGIPTVARLPINPKLAGACDKGMIELFEGDWLENLADALEKK